MSKLADFFLELGEGIVARIRKFSRKKTPREQLEETARWDRPCMRLMDGTCAVCHGVVLDPNAKCIGPPAAQRARRKLQEME